MKNQTFDKKQPSPAQTFNSRLTAYAATATGFFLIAPAAEAAVQTLNSPTISLNFDNTSSQQNINVGLFHGLIYGSNIFNSANSNHFSGGITCNHGSILRMPGGQRSAVNLSLGQAIAGTNWHFYGQLFHIYKSRHSNFTTGQFVLGGANQVKTGYVGFRAQQNAQTYYGWLRIQVSNDAQGRTDQISLLTDANGNIGAYDNKNSILSDNFTAGSFGVEPTPEPSVAALGGLALLACGSAGVREQRRRRLAQSKQNN